MQAEMADLLWLAVIKNGKVFCFQVAHRLAFVIQCHNVKHHQPGGRAQNALGPDGSIFLSSTNLSCRRSRLRVKGGGNKSHKNRRA